MSVSTVDPRVDIGHVHLKVADLYRDRPIADWPRDASGELMMVSDALDLRALLAEAQ